MKKDNVIENFLNRTFFTAWKTEDNTEDYLFKYGNYRRLELIIGTKCNLNCTYCYFRDREDLNASAPSDTILENLDMLLEWLSKNQYFPDFEVYGGEPLVRKLGLSVVEKCIDFFIDNKHKGEITIPTNFSFIDKDWSYQEVERLIEKSKNNNVHIHLSASVDGKYCDVNRPYKSGFIRDDRWYDKVFSFCKKHGFGFHPMIYSNAIEKWRHNFIWFQGMFEKYDIPSSYLYLLEVRNPEWNLDQIKAFYGFIRFAVAWSIDRARNEGILDENIPEYFFKERWMNLFTLFGSIGRGISCSIQACMPLKLSDLTVCACHRLAKPLFDLYRFVVKGQKIIGIEPLNSEMLFTIHSADKENFPYCESCLIEDMCSGQCLGAMFEVNGDPFIPIPTVCLLEHAKFKAVLDEIIEENMFEYWYNWVSEEKKRVMMIYRRMKNVGRQ